MSPSVLVFKYLEYLNLSGTREINFNENSYINWKLSQVHLMDHFTSDIQVMFRTRQKNGVLLYFKGQYSTREFMMLRVSSL
jgi:hypothetical protein